MFSGGGSNVAVKIRPKLHVNSHNRLCDILRVCVCVYTCCRCEIESTLERLRKLERELYSKEKELEERERRLRLWEERLMERSNMSPSPTSLLMERSNISPVSGSRRSLFRQLKTKFKKRPFYDLLPPPLLLLSVLHTDVHRLLGLLLPFALSGLQQRGAQQRGAQQRWGQQCWRQLPPSHPQQRRHGEGEQCGAREGGGFTRQREAARHAPRVAWQVRR